MSGSKLDQLMSMIGTPPERSHKGYHVTEIRKGILGDSSKILEEVMELIDAEQQGAIIMGLCELADIVGAIKHYLRRHAPSLTLADLETMADITEHAFLTGARK